MLVTGLRRNWVYSVEVEDVWESGTDIKLNGDRL